MTDAAARNKRNRQAGKRWEAEIRDGGRSTFGLDIERTRDTGTNDEGDLVIREGGHYFVIEAKNAKLEPTPFLSEASLEASNFAKHRGLPAEVVHPAVFVKRRQKGLAGGLVLLTVEEYVRLIKRGSR